MRQIPASLLSTGKPSPPAQRFGCRRSYTAYHLPRLRRPRLRPSLPASPAHPLGLDVSPGTSPQIGRLFSLLSGFRVMLIHYIAALRGCQPPGADRVFALRRRRPAAPPGRVSRRAAHRGPGSASRPARPGRSRRPARRRNRRRSRRGRRRRDRAVDLVSLAVPVPWIGGGSGEISWRKVPSPLPSRRWLRRARRATTRSRPPSPSRSPLAIAAKRSKPWRTISRWRSQRQLTRLRAVEQHVDRLALDAPAVVAIADRQVGAAVAIEVVTAALQTSARSGSGSSFAAVPAAVGVAQLDDPLVAHGRLPVTMSWMPSPSRSATTSDSPNDWSPSGEPTAVQVPSPWFR